MSKGELLNEVTGYREKSIVGDHKDHGKIGKDGFMKLLTTQLQNQNPLDPMDQSKFAADLAQFSQLEQMQNMNTTLSDVFQNNGDKEKFYAASFLGKEIFTAGSSVKVNDVGQKSDINFTLDNSAKKAMVRLFDGKNNMIRQIDLNELPKGQNTIIWDGVGSDGQPVSKGDYRIAVLAWDDNFERIPVDIKAKGVVKGVEFDKNGETVLIVDNKKVYLRDVQSFRLPQQKKVMHNGNIGAQRAANTYKNTAAEGLH